MDGFAPQMFENRVPRNACNIWYEPRNVKSLLLLFVNCSLSLSRGKPLVLWNLAVWILHLKLREQQQSINNIHFINFWLSICFFSPLNQFLNKKSLHSVIIIGCAFIIGSVHNVVAGSNLLKQEGKQGHIFFYPCIEQLVKHHIIHIS